MKKIIFIILCISTLSGCINTPILKERILVQMIGIDYDATSSNFKVTMQLFTPEGGGGKTSIDSSKQNVKYIENEGTNLYEAVNNAALQEGKFLFYGDNRVVVIGETAAKESLPQIMSFLNNDHESRSNLNIMVTKGDASQIIKTPLGQGIIPAQGIDEMIKNGSQFGTVYKADLLDVGQAFLNETRSPVIPVITLIEQENSKEKSNSSQSESDSTIKPISQYKVEGAAVFKNNKLTGYLNEAETRGLLFLINRASETVYPGKTSNIKYSTILLNKFKSKIKMTEENDNIVMNVKIKSHATVKEILLEQDITQLTDEDMKTLEQNIANQIKADCEAVIQKAIDEYGADLFYFGDIIWKSNPTLYKKIIAEQIDYLKMIQVSYDISININHVGLEQFLENNTELMPKQ